MAVVLAMPALVVDEGWTAVPWAWVSEGSGGAATRWFCTKMGFRRSCLTGLSSWEPACEDDDEGLAFLGVDGLLPIFASHSLGCFCSETKYLNSNE
jgi:hypothetical protein